MLEINAPAGNDHSTALIILLLALELDGFQHGDLIRCWDFDAEQLLGSVKTKIDDAGRLLPWPLLGDTPTQVASGGFNDQFSSS